VNFEFYVVGDAIGMFLQKSVLGCVVAQLVAGLGCFVVRFSFQESVKHIRPKKPARSFYTQIGDTEQVIGFYVLYFYLVHLSTAYCFVRVSSFTKYQRHFCMG
jgi:hypothetical protein